MKRASRTSGFTLLELVVVVAILTILAGVALPVAGKAWTSAARRATRERLTELARASLEFVRDVGRNPADVEELLVRPDDAAGWLGPYVAIEAVDPAGGHPAALDAWSRPIRIVPDADDASRFVLASPGADGVANDDDLAVAVDTTPVRRERTLRALDLANDALARWRGAHLGEALDRDWPRARARLVLDGYLSPGSDTVRDAWGQEFAPESAASASTNAAWELVSPALLARARAQR
ncbi:MAG: prepilin-type N-terminal cleavage/methylation domain-containing protein [Planctomycetes bacterium]|nr:prepilin-type N-terminal cleavage/methylation domain-containing protein [Planctomycetota bacterium]